MRNRWENTIIKLCRTDPEYQLELRNLLNKATKRDGQVLYEYGDPDIPSIRELKAYLRACEQRGFRGKISPELENARVDYHCWQSQRHKELEAQYNAMLRARKSSIVTRSQFRRAIE